ncbi:MBL fold metallo-hydrolase [Desertivirga brevis]|uniref:MBL fold metallo-hydrolase n=1 Tax=Desertivirga brevis TaxID=2810310 RepID=UPI001F614144|nr:MBL fold metallo-hydrolase [Pedobacter sp. SYSU D00873]
MTIYKSPNFNGKIFLNPIPTVVTKQGAFLKIIRENFLDRRKHLREPKKRLGPFPANPRLLNNLAPNGIRITWLGHSTLIMEVDGKRFLTDPVWSNVVSPFSFIGPKRFFHSPIKLEELPSIDGIIISHDHYDHLDEKTIRQIAKIMPEAQFFCGLGVSKWLKAFGADIRNIHEFGWWDELEIEKSFKIIATPARHFSGRGISDRYKTLWASWVIQGPEHTMFYGGDSGMFPGFAEIGEKYGPFDLTALEIGAADDDWEDIHMGPIKAAEAHLMLKGKVMLPIHWATFNLAPHPWEEPAEDLLVAAEKKGIKLLLPQPGETVSIKEYHNLWWRKYT